MCTWLYGLPSKISWRNHNHVILICIWVMMCNPTIVRRNGFLKVIKSLVFSVRKLKIILRDSITTVPQISFFYFVVMLNTRQERTKVPTWTEHTLSHIQKRKEVPSFCISETAREKLSRLESGAREAAWLALFLALFFT